MITVKPLSLMLSVALPVFGSGIAFGNFDALRDLDSKTHAVTRNLDIYDKADKVGERPIIEKRTLLTKYPSSSTASVLALVKPKALLDRQGPVFTPSDACDLPVLLPPCTDVISSRVSTQVSSSVSAAISSSVSISDASILTSITNSFSSSLLAARQAGHDEGFQEGQRRASEIAQSMISSSRASSSPTVEDTSCATETSSCAVEDLKGASHGLNLNAGQLAGILVAVFFISSISSILATIFILWYRRQRAASTDKTLPSQVEAPTRTARTMFEKLRANIFPSTLGRSTSGGHRDFPKGSLPRLPPQTHKAKPSADRASFTLPISTNITRDRVHPISPLSYHPPDHFMRESSPSLELGLYGDRTQIASRSETSGTPPIKLSLSRDATQNGPRRIQVVRMGLEGNTPHGLLSPDVRGSSDVVREGTASSAPMTTMSAFLPPIVPLRFSSLNAYKGFPIQRPSGSRGNDGTFLLSTDDESADRNPKFLQDQTGLQSPSHSSEISQDLTQFDPRGPSQQPTSRLSMSSTRLSLGYSASSTSPIPQYHQHQEHPEISPLRPAPSSPLQLQAPTPRRPNIAANVGVDGPIYTL